MEIVLAEPRGFCAGVRRAIETVEKALEKYGSPIYVKHEIVHNKFVINNFEAQGVIFTDDIASVPPESVIIYSAHGVSDEVENLSAKFNLIRIDATCPLVKKVHREVVSYEKKGFEIILVGHKDHPEIEGTSGKVKNPIILVETAEDARKIQPKNPDMVALATQTTLSLDDTFEIIKILQERFPVLKENTKNDICYATQNRQDAVKDMINQHKIELLIVVGSPNSSNSNRLRDIGDRYNIPAYLLNNAREIKDEWLKDINKIGITAGASAPEVLVESVVDYFKNKLPDTFITLMNGTKEDVIFHPQKI